jgi:hypothetical protein
MPNVWALLAAYALAFGLQNDKLKFLTDLLRRVDFMDRMLSCIYCTGFHCGWVVWLLTWGATGTPPASGLAAIPSVLLWALASAAWCYVVDALVQGLEARVAEKSE